MHQKWIDGVTASWRSFVVQGGDQAGPVALESMRQKCIGRGGCMVWLGVEILQFQFVFSNDLPVLLKWEGSLVRAGM